MIIKAYFYVKNNRATEILIRVNAKGYYFSFSFCSKSLAYLLILWFI